MANHITYSDFVNSKLYLNWSGDRDDNYIYEGLLYRFIKDDDYVYYDTDTLREIRPEDQLESILKVSRLPLSMLTPTNIIFLYGEMNWVVVSTNPNTKTLSIVDYSDIYAISAQILDAGILRVPETPRDDINLHRLLNKYRGKTLIGLFRNSDWHFDSKSMTKINESKD